MARDSAVLQFRVDDDLKQAFTEAARRDHTTTSHVLRRLVQQDVRESLHREAARQSRLVVQAPDEEESMDLLQAVQGFDRD